MSPRAALALVRAPSVSPRFALPMPGRSTARTLAAGSAALVLVVLAYAVARETSVFAVRSVAVRGDTPAVAADVRPVLDAVKGSSLVAVDGDELARRLRAVPSVREATVDRAFPHTLSVTITPERPLAVVRQGGGAWLVAETGRVVREITPASRRGLPRIGVALERPPTPGATLPDSATTTALAVLRAVPPRFPAIRTARVVDGEVEIVLRGGTAVRLGPPTDVPTKLASAAAVLSSLSPEESAALAYLDVSVPSRAVVAAGDTQL